MDPVQLTLLLAAAAAVVSALTSAARLWIARRVARRCLDAEDPETRAHTLAMLRVLVPPSATDWLPRRGAEGEGSG